VAIPKSGFNYPNRMARSFLLGLEDVMGRHGVSAILNLAGLSSWVRNYPDDSLDRGIDFADFSTIIGALEVMYGPRAGRGLARRSSWLTFDTVICQSAALTSPDEPERAALPAAERLQRGLEEMAHWLAEFGDERIAVRQAGESLLYAVQPCPVCWGRKSAAPTCAATAGLLEEAARHLTGGQMLRVQETECIAAGGGACEFRIELEPHG
jgi:predicted hydrocarbon binding protein